MLFVSGCLSCISLVLLIASLVFWHYEKTLEYCRTGRALGTVVYKTESKYYDTIKVKFTVDSITYIHSVVLRIGERAPKVGSPVVIRYAPEEPDAFSIEGQRDTGVVWQYVFFLMAVVFMIISLVCNISCFIIE